MAGVNIWTAERSADEIIKASMQMWAEIAIESELERDTLPHFNIELLSDYDMSDETDLELWLRR